MLHLGISGILKDILAGSGLVATMSVSPALSRPPEQVMSLTRHILTLTCAEGVTVKVW